MKKQKTVFRYYRYEGNVLHARREIPYELRLSSRMILDELCFNWNKARLEAAINSSIDERNEEKFLQLSKEYKHYIWE